MSCTSGSGSSRGIGLARACYGRFAAFNSGAVATTARGEATRTSFGFTAIDGRDAEPEFIQDRILPTQSPLLDRREPIAAQCRLWQACQLVRQLLGSGERLTGFDDPISETDPLGLLP